VNNEQEMRLSRKMALMGICSRREADEYISRGLVRVNGKTAMLGQKVTENDVITVSREAQSIQSGRVTVILHKPLGYVSGQAEDGYRPARVLIRPENHWRGDRSAARFSPNMLRNLVPAGRLDINSTGLLVLTQDGRTARAIIGEDSSIDKEYLVRVRGEVTPQSLELLSCGLWLDGEPLLPAKVRIVEPGLLNFVLHQGKKRQIRRMCAAVGLEVTALKRIRVGRVRLGRLPQGQWRFLGENEQF
jgi:23S rRNA pseudouridine2604 synthase